MIYEFGNRNKPLGNFDQKLWNDFQPNWKQVRSIACAEVIHAKQECGCVDALWTRFNDLPIAVITADCVPLLLHQKDFKAVAAIHAGWEGTLQRIVPHFFNHLPQDLAQPADWIVRIGPSIRACCYEFGLDLIEKFKDVFPGITPTLLTPTPRHLDLIAILKHELSILGVKIESVDPRCTYCSQDEAEGREVPEFFSYRRGDRNSRQYSIVMKTK